MTVYAKSMMESLAEVRGLIVEDNMDLMKKAAAGSMQTIKMKDGKLKMDSFTASGIMQVYDKVNPKNKKTMEQIINSGKKNQIMKLQAIAMKAEYNPQEEEVELDEAKYDIYHKDFSSAMQHAYAAAKKMYGITIKPSEIDDKVASGPRKPSSGKTNKYRLKGDKGTVQIQVANLDNKKYELNMYKEEVELDEGDPFMGPTKGKDKVVTVRHKTSGKELSVTANSVKKYEKMGYKVVKETTKIGERVAEQLARIKGNSPGAQGRRAAVEDDLERAENKGDKKEVAKLKESRMKELHGYIAQGKSAEWIAKKMGVDAKTIKALMAGYKEAYEVGTDEYREYLEKLTPGEVDEASARADAMRAMGRDKKVDPADVDTDASDADVKSASKNILAQMRKAVSLGGRFDVEFLDKKKVRVKPAIANAFVKKYEGMRKPADKEKFQNQAMKSYKDMLKVLKAGYYHEEVELDEALPSHLKKHFDKDGNPKSKEGKAAWERIKKIKMKGYTPKQVKMAIGVAFDKRFVQGNMTGAAKTIEKIAKGLSDFEPVANALRRANEEVVKEGTWHIAKDMKGLKKILSKPLKAKDAIETLAPFIGDDILYDDIGEMKPNDDARSVIKKAMKRLRIKEETILDRIDRKLKERR